MTARFSQGQVSGSSACNQYQGTYTVEGAAAHRGASRGNDDGVSAPVMEIEDAFRGAFGGGGRFAVENDRLTLTSKGGVVLVFRAQPEAGVEGPTWSVTGYNNGRQAMVSPLLHTELTLVFRDGMVSGSSGCNSYTASYTRGGDRLALRAPGLHPQGVSRARTSCSRSRRSWPRCRPSPPGASATTASTCAGATAPGP